MPSSNFRFAPGPGVQTLNPRPFFDQDGPQCAVEFGIIVEWHAGPEMVHQMQVLLQREDPSAWPMADPGRAITICSIKRVMGQPLEKDVKVEHAKLGWNEPQEEPLLSMSGKQRCG